jgi:cytochrome c6
MKNTILKVTRTLLVTGACAALTGASAMAADDGAALFKQRCASCHGAQGEGTPAMKAPALKGTSLGADQVVERVTKGNASSKAPHNKGMSGLTPEKAKAVAEHVKAL